MENISSTDISLVNAADKILGFTGSNLTHWGKSWWIYWIYMNIPNYLGKGSAPPRIDWSMLMHFSRNQTSLWITVISCIHILWIKDETFLPRLRIQILFNHQPDAVPVPMCQVSKMLIVSSPVYLVLGSSSEWKPLEVSALSLFRHGSWWPSGWIDDVD